MVEINGKVYRNLQEQVEKNKEDIEDIKEHGTGETYTAGENIQISSDNVISATDTKYTAGYGLTFGDPNEFEIDSSVVAIKSDIPTIIANPEIGELDNPIQLEHLQVGTDKYWIPTDTSDLTNGAGFITSSDLPEGLQVYLHTYYSHYVTETTEGWAILKYSSTSPTSMPWDSDTDLMDLNEGLGSWAIATGWYKNASNEVHMIITASVDKTNRYVWFNIEGSQSQSLAGSVWNSKNANATNGHKVDPQKFPRI